MAFTMPNLGFVYKHLRSSWVTTAHQRRIIQDNERLTSQAEEPGVQSFKLRCCRTAFFQTANTEEFFHCSDRLHENGRKIDEKKIFQDA